MVPVESYFWTCFLSKLITSYLSQKVSFCYLALSMSDSLWPHGLQHTRLPRPSSSPGVCSNSCPLSWLCPSNHLILCRPLCLLPSAFPASRSFPKSHSLHQVTKILSFSFSISPSKEYSGLISVRIDWLDLLAVQGTLKSFLQHHSSKSLVLQHSAFFMVQPSHPFMTTGKTITFAAAAAAAAKLLQ